MTDEPGFECHSCHESVSDDMHECPNCGASGNHWYELFSDMSLSEFNQWCIDNQDSIDCPEWVP